MVSNYINALHGTRYRESFTRCNGWTIMVYPFSAFSLLVVTLRGAHYAERAIGVRTIAHVWVDNGARELREYSEEMHSQRGKEESGGMP
jgi:hypothetical protein